MHKAVAICLTLVRAVAILLLLLSIGMVLVFSTMETALPSLPVPDPVLVGMLTSVAAVTIGPTLLWLVGRNWRRRPPAEINAEGEAAAGHTVIFVLASLLAVWLLLTLLAADIGLYVVAVGILLLWLWLVARRRTRRALAPSMGRSLIILVATVTAPVGLLLLSGAAPWTLAPHQGTIAFMSADPSFTDSDSPDGDTMGGFLVMNFDDRSCTYHYPVYHHRLHVIETALQAGDRVSFLAPDLAGQVCGGYGIEIVDLRHDGKLVLRQHSQRAVRALWGAALLALGLATLLWWVRGVRRRA